MLNEYQFANALVTEGLRFGRPDDIHVVINFDAHSSCFTFDYTRYFWNSNKQYPGMFDFVLSQDDVQVALRYLQLSRQFLHDGYIVTFHLVVQLPSDYQDLLRAVGKVVSEHASVETVLCS